MRIVNEGQLNGFTYRNRQLFHVMFNIKTTGMEFPSMTQNQTVKVDNKYILFETEFS